MKKEAMQPVCVQCGNDMSEDVARKSLTWYKGMVGVRIKLCSVQCRDKWDESLIGDQHGLEGELSPRFTSP